MSSSLQNRQYSNMETKPMLDATMSPYIAEHGALRAACLPDSFAKKSVTPFSVFHYPLRSPDQLSRSVITYILERGFPVSRAKTLQSDSSREPS